MAGIVAEFLDRVPAGSESINNFPLLALRGRAGRPGPRAENRGWGEMETRWASQAPSCFKNSTMVKQPEQSNASRSTRTSNGVWPNSRNSFAAIRRASRGYRGSRPFPQGKLLAKSAENLQLICHISATAKRAKRANKVMAHWPLWRRIRRWQTLTRFLGSGWRDLDAMFMPIARKAAVGDAWRTGTAGSKNRGELTGQRLPTNWGSGTRMHSSPRAISHTRSSWYTACHSLQPGFTSPLCQARYRERVKSFTAPELRLSRI